MSSGEVCHTYKNTMFMRLDADPQMLLETEKEEINSSHFFVFYDVPDIFGDVSFFSPLSLTVQVVWRNFPLLIWHMFLNTRIHHPT